jgi:hypothetical protein
VLAAKGLIFPLHLEKRTIIRQAMRSCGKPSKVADWLSRYGLASYNTDRELAFRLAERM